MSRPQIVRCWQISRLLNDGRIRTLANMADELEISRRTLIRDLRAMRADLGLPIRTDRRGVRFAWRVTLCAFCSRPI